MAMGLGGGVGAGVALLCLGSTHLIVGINSGFCTGVGVGSGFGSAGGVSLWLQVVGFG